MALSLKENMTLVYQHKVPEYIPLASDYNSIYPGGPDFVNEHPSFATGVAYDWFGQSWTYEPKIGASNPTPGVHLLTDITQWEDVIKFPAFDKMDWAGYAARDTASWDRERKLTKVTVGYGIWERMFSIMPFDEALVSLVAEPEACYAFFGAMADHKIRLHEYVLNYYKPDVFCMHDDYGSGGGMFMAPETWRRLIKPHLQRIIDHVRSHDVLYEHHCCGYYVPILEEMADMGVTAHNPVHVSNKPGEIKRQLGHKLTFCGGFDNQFIAKDSTTVEDVRAHVRKTVDELAPGGSWVPLVLQKPDPKTEALAEELLNYSTNYYGARPKA